MLNPNREYRIEKSISDWKNEDREPVQSPVVTNQNLVE